MAKETNISVNINIDDYLSEEEKKEIAGDYFRSTLESNFPKGSSGKDDAERDRHIGNIYHSIIFTEVQKYLPDFQTTIKDKIIEVLNTKDLNFQIFREKDNYFGHPQSLALNYIDETIKENKELIEGKIIEKINSFDYDKKIIEELQSIIENSYSNIYDLFDKLKSKENE